MAIIPPLKLTRDQFASFLQDFEQIKQFENLFATVQTLAPIVGTDFEFQADTAAARANEALALISALTQQSSINSSEADSKAVQALDAINAIAKLAQLAALAPAQQNNNSVVTDYIDLPAFGPHVTQARRVQWNEDDGTVDIGLLRGSVLQVGQESMYRVENNTGSPITNGTVCGAVGVSPAGYVRVAPYQATTVANAKFLLGVATVDIPSGELGYVTEFGMVRDINTAAFPPGTVLYASGTTPGAFTATPPTTPIPKLIVALSAIQNATTGMVLVRPGFGASLEELHDVALASLQDRNLLMYDLANQQWVNQPASAVQVLTWMSM